MFKFNLVTLGEDNQEFHTKKIDFKPATELFNKILSICRQSYVKAKGVDDAGIDCMETLGIKQWFRNPDYKGIEIKSSRKRTTKPTLLVRNRSLVILIMQRFSSARGKNDPKNN